MGRQRGIRFCVLILTPAWVGILGGALYEGGVTGDRVLGRLELGAPKSPVRRQVPHGLAKSLPRAPTDPEIARRGILAGRCAARPGSGAPNWAVLV